MTFECISIDEAIVLLAEGDITVADVRDKSSYQLGRIADASLLNNNTLASFIEAHDFTRPVLVYCYHGHSSQGAAQHLAQQGFEKVYSLDGGFEEWRHQHQPTNTPN